MMGDVEFADLLPPEVGDTIVSLRHELHRYPELSSEETRTAELLESTLAQIRPKTLRRVAGTGVIARISGRDPAAPVIALRGDIDALPIQEETGVDFASRNDGVMHACGHDVHAAWTVGAALSLTAAPAEGDVLVLLQPAEETAQGARAVLESGALEDVSAILGAHVDMHYPAGSVVAQAGHMAASADEFKVSLSGAGSHAARPHEGRNPIVGGAALINVLQSVIPRTVAPGQPAVLTVSTFNGGAVSNVIPESALLTGTLRAANSVTREALQLELTNVARQIGAAFGLETSIEYLAGTPPLVNEPAAIGWVREAVVSILGRDALMPLAGPNLGGEDFAFYLERMRGCFFRVGGCAMGQPHTPAHSSGFLPEDASVLVGAAVLAESARIASKRLAE